MTPHPRLRRPAWTQGPMTRQKVRTVLLLTALVVRFLAIQHAGAGAYQDGRYLDAAGRYRSAGHLNPFEDWVAAFDAGAARHTEGQYVAAASAYDAALDLDVPHRDQCTVRINLSLAEEAIGDRAAKHHDLDKADGAYRDGVAALEDGHCPTSSGRGKAQTKDAKTVEERLKRKLQHNQQQKKQDQKKNRPKSEKQKKQQQQDKKRQQERRRERQLQRQNERGQKDRRKQQQLDQGYGYEPNW